MKLVGLVLIISVTLTVGNILSLRLKKRWQSLDKMIRALEYIKHDICIMDRKMETVLKNADRRFDMCGVFLNTEKEYIEKGIKTAWEESIVNSTDSLCLKKDDIEVLKDFGENLGKTCADDQRENIDSVILRLRINLNSAKEDYNKNGMLFRKCSVLAGLMLAIMLI